jgi:hypothetical protein
LKWFVAVTTLVLVISDAVGAFRHKPYSEMLPVVIATMAAGAIFNGVERGYDSLGWFLVPIAALIAPQILSLFRARQHDSPDS